MNTKGKIVAFRATEKDLSIIETVKNEMSEGIRKVTDADVIREGLLALSQKKNMKNSGDGVKQEITKEMVQPVHTYVSQETPVHIGIDKSTTTDHSVRSIHRTDSEGNTNIEVQEIDGLTEEEIAKGYQMVRGEKCDMHGFPVEEMVGDVVVRGGQVYATDPHKAEIKEKAEKNSAEVLTEEVGGVKMNPRMAEFVPDLAEKLERQGIQDEEFIGGDDVELGDAQEEADYSI